MFGQLRPIERELEAKYSSILTGMLGSPAEAKKMAKEMIRQCIEESKKQGTYDWPSGLGQLVLEGGRSRHQAADRWAEAVRRRLHIKREDGVTDDDIRGFWNLHDIERRMIEKVDENARMALFLHSVHNSEQPTKELAFAEAEEKVRKYHPKYGYSGDSSCLSQPGATRDDRPLPCELIDRVNRYIERRTADDQEAYKRDIEASSTFNALVRREIRAGRL
jgi:hypothetical protein